MSRIGIAFIFAIGMMVPLVASAHTDTSNGKLKNFQHVFVIMMENTGYDSLIGNTNAPWINMAAKTYGVATNYFGVTHPSQPNYIAATSGSTNGVPDDNDITINVPNIVDQIEGSGRTWKAYMQSYSLCGPSDVLPGVDPKLAHACGNQLYERKHNPFVSYLDVQSNPARMANLVDFNQFTTDLANKNVPDYSWISPDQCNDMHGRGGPATDPCRFANVQGLIATGDAFLNSTVSAIMNSQAWNGNSVIFITWDESDFTGSGPFGFGDTSGCCDANPGGGHVLTLTISHSDHSSRTSNVAYNHYSMLSTIEQGWSLGCLAFTCDTANVPAMSDRLARRQRSKKLAPGGVSPSRRAVWRAQPLLSMDVLSAGGIGDKDRLGFAELFYSPGS
jgi:phospholipase C